MNLKRNIGKYALITGVILVIIGESFNIIQNDLTTKQLMGAYLTILAAICIFAAIFYSIRKNTYKK